jgi:hypothetical protein
MKNTSWQPTGEALDKPKRELSTAIRARLPGIELLSQPGWAFGALSEPDTEAVQPKQQVQLKSLHWRLVETIDWEQRAAARGVFSGQAWAQGGLIDFTGDAVRDLVTGAFLEFQLLTMGL